MRVESILSESWSGKLKINDDALVLMMIKKFAGAIMICGALVACGSAPDQTETPESEVEYIAKDGGGIGDVRATFDDRRGVGSESASGVIYQNGYIRATYVESDASERAQRIDISFEATDTSVVSMERATEVAETFLPKDVVKEVDQQDEDGFYHIQYTSEDLSEVFDPGWFHGGEPGDVTATFWQRDGDPDQIFAITISTGGIK